MPCVCAFYMHCHMHMPHAHATCTCARVLQVSNYSGTAYAPTGVRTGQEWTSAEMGEQQNPQQLQDVESVGSAMSGGGSGRRARSKSNAKSWAAVQSITVDSFARSEGLSHIHWLSIDAEGW